MAVPTALDTTPTQKVHVATEDGLEFILHPFKIEQGVFRCRMESGEDVHIALRAKVLSENRAKKAKPSDLPAPAEARDVIDGPRKVPIRTNTAGASACRV